MIIHWLASKKFRFKLDQYNGYHNIKIDSKCVKSSTLSCSEGNLDSTVIQLGDKNASRTMMRAMSYILAKSKGKPVMIYLEDILIGTDTYEEHKQVVREILQILKDQGFYLNNKKCQIRPDKLEVLEFILTTEGLRMDHHKVDTIASFPEPKTKKKLQQFISMVNYLSRFCPRLTEKGESLTSIQESTQQHK